MRRAERPAIAQRAAGELASDRGDHRHIEQLTRVERRQDGGQPLRQHRFARTGRADHQEIVAAGGGDLERPARHLLAAHFAQIRQAGIGVVALGQRPRAKLITAEMIDEGEQ